MARTVHDDHAVVQRVLAGDAAAYDDLVGRHGDRLYAMLLHLANGDRDLAAEFTQEALVRAFTCLDQFAGGSSFYTWLYRLARNRALDLLARKRPRSGDLESLGAAAATPEPGARLADEELKQAVHRALALLPPDQRELIVLRDFDGCDYVQLAALLDVPEGTVKSRLSRARAALRDLLAPHLGAEDLA